jgi:hypothetical protein
MDILLLSSCVQGMYLLSCCLAMEICVTIWFRTGPFQNAKNEENGLNVWLAYISKRVEEKVHILKWTTLLSLEDVQPLDCINVHILRTSSVLGKRKKKRNSSLYALNRRARWEYTQWSCFPLFKWRSPRHIDSVEHNCVHYSNAT